MTASDRAHLFQVGYDTTAKMTGQV